MQQHYITRSTHRWARVREQDLRRHSRLKVGDRAEVWLGGGELQEARILDFSLGGVGLVTDRKLPVGSLVHFRSQNLLLEGSGIVRDSVSVAGGYRIGIGFEAPCSDPLVTLVTERISSLHELRRVGT